MNILYFIIGIMAGFVIGLIIIIIQRKRMLSYTNSRQQELQEECNRLDKAKSIAEDRLQQIKEQWDQQLEDLRRAHEKVEKLQTDNATLQTTQEILNKKIEEKKIELEETQSRLRLEFENMAQKVLKQNTEELGQFNREKIEEILKPFRERLNQLETNVTDTYQKSLRDTSALQNEVKNLYELSKKLGEEANNLTRALKGDVKKQGNWGEVVLERILERSGLRKGYEYETQSTDHDEEGKMLRPDVIIHLPDKKHLIIDSKVSLKAYEQVVNSEGEEDRKRHMKAHVDSIKAHIKILAGKHYQQGKLVNSPDFVLLFVPIESSFSLAVQEDQELFQFAWDNRIVVVSPSTLLATLLTIASMWKQENQTRNALEIAKASGLLYDKFVGFIDDMERIGKGIGTAQQSYNDAIGKLSTGPGNLIKKAENIKKMGANTSKNIPDRLISDKDTDDTVDI